MLCSPFLTTTILLLLSISTLTLSHNGILHATPNSPSSHPPTPLPSRPKVFLLGLPGTGTASIVSFLSHLSYRHSGKENFHGNLTLLAARSREHDAFSDLPWSLMYREMAALHPDAKFVLTLREDVNAWLESVNRERGDGKGDVWEGWDSYGFQIKHADDNPAVDGDEDSEIYLHTYRTHAASVREFFATPHQEGRLLQIVFDDPNESGNWTSLSHFLGLDPSAIDELPRNHSPCDHAESNPGRLVNNWLAHHKQKALRKAKKALLKVLHVLGWLTAAGL